MPARSARGLLRPRATHTLLFARQLIEAKAMEGFMSKPQQALGFAAKNIHSEHSQQSASPAVSLPMPGGAAAAAQALLLLKQRELRA